MLISDAESYEQGLLSTVTKPLIGESTSTLSGEEHRKRRRMPARRSASSGSTAAPR